ncbi:MAG: hypothetical protein ACTHJ0_06940 [Flavipsychrobacter sp.]
MQQDKMEDQNENRGSGPLPEEAINKGDGTHDESKAQDKEFLKESMKGNLETAKKDNTSGSATERIDELQKQADEEKGIRKPGSQSNSSDQHNNGRGGGK